MVLFREYCFRRENSLTSAANSISSAKKTQWVRFGTQIIGCEELTEFASGTKTYFPRSWRKEHSRRGYEQKHVWLEFRSSGKRQRTQRAQRSKIFDPDRNFWSRSKFLISLENFNLDVSISPQKIGPRVGGSLENFILARNFQSRSKSRIFFDLWALWGPEASRGFKKKSAEIGHRSSTPLSTCTETQQKKCFGAFVPLKRGVEARHCSNPRTMKTPTSLIRSLGRFCLSDDSIWRFPSVSSLSDYSIWRSWRLFWPYDHSIWSILSSMSPNTSIAFGPPSRYGWHFPEEIPEKFRKDPGNALRAFPGIPVESTAGMPQTL